MKKFCFVCGKDTDKLIEGYCEDCYNKKFSLVSFPKDMSYIICTKCKKLKVGTGWEDMSIEDYVKRLIKINGVLTKIVVGDGKVTVTGVLDKCKKQKEETHDVKLKKIKAICLRCSHEAGGYYEAILQIRCETSQKILDFIDRRINQDSYYRVEKVRGGYDLYVGNKAIANEVAELLKKNYKLKIVKSYKMYTRKEGRDMYRTMISVFCDE